MHSYRAFRGWVVLAVSLFVAVVACSGSTTTVSGVGGGSALCGPNGTNQCGAKKCDPLLGCVDCATDADCPASAKLCVAGTCSVCRTNPDCGTGATPACWPQDHTCHAACANNTTCPQDQSICNVSTGACVGCNTAADCPAGTKICDATTQQCVACATNADCPAAAPRCLAGRGQCVQCLANTDCGTAAPVCDPQEFKCRTGCTTDAQCPAAAVRCNTTTSTCVQCLTSGDCVNNSGTTPICSDGGRCVQCQIDANCAAPTPLCDQAHCVQCKKDRDCPAATPSCNNGTCGG